MKNIQASDQGINLRLWSLVTAVVLLCTFVFFVVIYEAQVNSEARKQLEAHARTLAGNLWNFNRQGTALYLGVITRTDNYVSAVVKSEAGEVFVRKSGKEPGRIVHALEWLGFERVQKLREPITFRGENIGRIVVDWYPKTGKIHGYVFLVLLLLGVVLHLIYRLYNSKVDLTGRVQKRVSELQESNRALIREVKEREKTEEELQRSEKKFRSYIECSPHGIFVQDAGQGFSEVNPALCRLSGFAEEELLGKELEDLIPDDRRTNEGSELVNLPEEDEVHFSTPVEQKSGVVKHWEISAVNLSGNKILGMVTDITERRRTRGQLEESLREKEVLLQEIHHRVKNNLFTIISLLELQKVKYDDEKLVGILRRSINRIHSMALIHKQIYSSEMNAVLEFDQYLEQLVNELKESAAPPNKVVEVELDLEPVRLELERAIPCALAVNELVDNALTHGLVDRDKILLRIEVTEENGTILLRVADDGSGLPDGFDLADDASMGLNLVTKLIENQLKGSLEYWSDDWTNFKLEFKKSSVIEEET